MQISTENKSHQLSVWWLQFDQLEKSGRSLDELNEYLWASESGKQQK